MIFLFTFHIALLCLAWITCMNPGVSRAVCLFTGVSAIHGIAVLLKLIGLLLDGSVDFASDGFLRWAAGIQIITALLALVVSWLRK